MLKLIYALDGFNLMLFLLWNVVNICFFLGRIMGSDSGESCSFWFRNHSIRNWVSLCFDEIEWYSYFNEIEMLRISILAWFSGPLRVHQCIN